MLNLSKENKVSISDNNYKSIAKLNNPKHYHYLNKIIGALLLIVIIILFLPWTQNIKGNGSVTALKPNQRPQTVQTLISGRIQNWYVNEGDYVQEGDTLMFISEVKEDYLDPQLLDNTKDQMDAKALSVESYKGKVKALDDQMQFINNELNLKLKQALNKQQQSLLKIKSDSMDLIAVKTQLKIANTQYTRSVQLNTEGLKPLTDVEEKRLKLQDIEAKIITQENKILTSKNDYINAKVEFNRIQAEYSEKITKAKSDQYSALSNQFDTKAQVSKLKNQYTNYQIRNGMYYITAPQSGYISRAIQSGIGETIKEGTPIVSIMPEKYDLAVETYVSATDLPLLANGQKIRIWFDGWPSIVFSGWPDASYGTFGGKIVAIENFMSENGKYRILIAPDNQDKKWPQEVRIGSGVQTIALLKTVPIWYEMWRNLNGFPPDYYNKEKKDSKTKKK